MKNKFIVLLAFVFLGACSTAPVEEDMSDWIVLDQPSATQAGACPLVVTGEARGPWYFEATFPIQIVDADGSLLAQGQATAQSDWMTEDFVPFTAKLYYEGAATEGSLILKNDNPSGLPENEKSLTTQVKLQSCDAADMGIYEHPLVEEYLRANISSLSSVAPVLGGTWYVVSVEFEDDRQVHVIYEDGHIQEEFQASYRVSADGGVEVTLE